MAYKPYKTQQRNDIYSQRYKSSDSYESGRVKLFGFRSGVAYKMVLALLYYGLMLMVYIPSIVNEIVHYHFTVVDVILDISKYLFIGIFLFSPAIFLSNFNYVEKIPFFRKKSFGSSLCGLILVFMFCYFMWNVDILCMSKTYKDSVEAYTKELRAEEEKKKEQEKETEASEGETIETSSFSAIDIQYILEV